MHIENLMVDFYQILGVTRDADADTLKKAYRKLRDNIIQISIKNQEPRKI